MALRFAKVVGHARPPEKINPNDPGMTIFSAEDFKLEHGEIHSYRTGIILEVPEGAIILLMENSGMGVKGITVAGGSLTPNDVGEVRVNLINAHRESFEIKAGDPLCFALVFENVDKLEEDAEEHDFESLSKDMKALLEEQIREDQEVEERQREAAGGTRTPTG